MNAQLARKCPECFGELLQITCDARTHHLVIEENGSQYSIWKHIGSHRSHPRLPAGRRPPHSVPSHQVAHTPTLAHKPDTTSAVGIGSHHSHPHLPAGRRPLRSVPSHQVAHTPTPAHKPDTASAVGQGLFNSLLIQMHL